MAFGEFDKRVFLLFATVAVAAIIGCVLVDWSAWLLLQLPLLALSGVAVFISAGGIHVIAVLWTKFATGNKLRQSPDGNGTSQANDRVRSADSKQP